MSNEKTRPIYEIVHEIEKDWKKPYFGAIPYISAMHGLSGINDSFYQDSARSVLRYFLANASTWRGETAKRIKLELKQLLK
jgi:hypothetical protein